jgi:glycosyltransferase involved in cell wall biosynthesis
VPAFNEAKRLPETLYQMAAYLSEQPWRSRVVVVDNGSVDETAAVVRSLRARRVDITVIGCARPGKGAAVRRGLLHACSPFVGFVDADLSTPLDTLATAMHELRQGAAAVVASRHAPGARFVQPQPLGRRLGGTAFRLLARPLVAKVHDTQCGFKFFQREVVQNALQRCRLTGFAFDVELLRQIQLSGGRIVEAPVAWTDDAHSSFRPLRDGLPSFAAMLQLYGGATR